MEYIVMKKVTFLVVFIFSVFATSAHAGEFGCMGGGVLAGGVGYAIGKQIHPNAAIGLGLIGSVLGCKGASKVEDGTYGQQPTPQSAPVRQEPTIAIDGNNYYGSNPGVTAAAARTIARDAALQQKVLECEAERWEPSSCRRILRSWGFRSNRNRSSGSGYAYIEPNQLNWLNQR